MEVLKFIDFKCNNAHNDIDAHLQLLLNYNK